MSERIVSWIVALRRRPFLLRSIFFGALGFFVLFDFFTPRHTPHFVGDQIRGFWALFGFLGCIAMARFMKGIGHLWLMKPMDFYGPESGEE